MTTVTFGYLLVALIVVAFFVNFIRFESRARRQLQQYEFDAQRLTEELKQEQLERERGQALIHTQTYIISEAEERIRSLEEKMSTLEQLARRMDQLSDHFSRRKGRLDREP